MQLLTLAVPLGRLRQSPLPIRGKEGRALASDTRACVSVDCGVRDDSAMLGLPRCISKKKKKLGLLLTKYRRSDDLGIATPGKRCRRVIILNVECK